MTFNQVFLKMFKANLRRYLLFFLCSSFAIMVFFTYSTILTNNNFMNSSQVNSVISSMLIAPSIGVVLFSIILIIYAHNSFIKFRRTEFGLFMVLGMTNWDIGRIMFLENSLIGLFSLLTGLISGRLFSSLFYVLIIKIIDIKGIPFSVSNQSYLYTIIFFIVIYSIVILINFLLILNYQIINLLKESRKEDSNIINIPLLAFIGIILIGISVIDMVIHYKSEKNIVFIRSIFLCYIGIYLLLSNMIWFLSKILILSKKYVQNILFISNLKYTFGKSKLILFLIIILVSITIFFSNLSISFILDSKKFALDYNPYQIVYVEIFGKNQISDELLNTIIETGKTKLNSIKKIEFIYDKSIIILSDDNLNSNLGSNIHVQKNHFINLFQIVTNDGYEHDINEIKELNIENKSYSTEGKIIKVLFNNIPIASNYVILNNSDYLEIKSKTKSKMGFIKLINFEDWSKTEEISDKLTKELQQYNKDNTKLIWNEDVDIKTFKPITRIGNYLERKEAGSFMLFLFSFVGLLFFLSTIVILHFKLLTEFEREKIKYKKLNKIGITEKEISALIYKELKVLFILPVLMGIIVAIFYNYMIIGNGMSIKYSLISGLIYLSMQFVFYFSYKRFYVKRFY